MQGGDAGGGRRGGMQGGDAGGGCKGGMGRRGGRMLEMVMHLLLLSSSGPATG